MKIYYVKNVMKITFYVIVYVMSNIYSKTSILLNKMKIIFEFVNNAQKTANYVTMNLPVINARMDMSTILVILNAMKL